MIYIEPSNKKFIQKVSSLVRTVSADFKFIFSNGRLIVSLDRGSIVRLGYFTLVKFSACVLISYQRINILDRIKE